MRASVMAATVVQPSVAGSQISAGSTAADSESDCPVPPMAMTLPSASSVRFIRRRAKAIGAISRHAGDAAVMSITAARLMAGSPPPARRILPGRYMTSDSE